MRSVVVLLLSASFSLSQLSLLPASSQTTPTMLWEYAIPIPKQHRDRPSAGKISLAPDGKLVAAAVHGMPTSILILNSQTGRLLRELAFPRSSNSVGVYCTAFSPDGLKLAAAGSDGIIAVWNTESWSRIGDWNLALPEPIWDIEYSPDGQRLAAVTHDSVTEWDTSNWQQVRTSPDGVRGSDIAYSPDGRLLGVGSAHSILSTGDFQLLPVAGEQTDQKLDFTPSGLLVSSPDTERLLTFMDVCKRTEVISVGKLRGTMDLKRGYTAFAIDASKDNRTVAMGDNVSATRTSGSILIARANRDWSIPLMGNDDTGLKQPRNFTGTRQLPPTTRYTRLLDDGSTLVTAAWSDSEPSVITYWDLATSSSEKTIPLPVKKTHSISVSAEGKYIAHAGESGVEIYQSETGTAVTRIPLNGTPYNLEYINDGSLLFANNGLYNKNGKQVAVGVGDSNSSLISVSREAQLLAADGYGSVDLWSLDTAKKLRSIQFRKPRSGSTAPHLSPDGRWLICCIEKSDANKETIEIYDLHANKLTTSISASGPIYERSTAISPDNNKLAFAVVYHGGKQISLLDIPTGKLLNEWVYSDLALCAINFSPSGDSLLITSTDGTTRDLPIDFDTSDTAWQAHSGRISDVELADDSSVIYSSGDDGYIRSWKLGFSF